jgi:hypothetical protein
MTHYCVIGAVVNEPRFSVGELVGITPNKTSSQIRTIPKPKSISQFLVPPRFFSNRGIVPNISAIYAEK